ncbi:MAG: hypothetical protein RLZZ216_494 [Cyanobacteriota bacterium]
MSSELLQTLETISRERSDRVVRLRGMVTAGDGGPEPLEVLIFRGFSSCTTHPTAFDPDQSVLPDGACIQHADLLQGPLNPLQEQLLLEGVPPERLLDPLAWG